MCFVLWSIIFVQPSTDDLQFLLSGILQHLRIVRSGDAQIFVMAGSRYFDGNQCVGQWFQYATQTPRITKSIAENDVGCTLNMLASPLDQCFVSVRTNVIFGVARVWELSQIPWNRLEHVRFAIGTIRHDHFGARLETPAIHAQTALIVQIITLNISSIIVVHVDSIVDWSQQLLVGGMWSGQVFAYDLNRFHKWWTRSLSHDLLTPIGYAGSFCKKVAGLG